MIELLEGDIVITFKTNGEVYSYKDNLDGKTEEEKQKIAVELMAKARFAMLDADKLIKETK